MTVEVVKSAGQSVDDTDRTNPNARDIREEYPNQSVRYSDFWKEVRFQVAIGPRNGLIIGMAPDAPGVKP